MCWTVRLRYISGILLAAGSIVLCPLSLANPGNIPPPEIAARAYVLVDAHSGTELSAQDADTPLPPASLTKLMTAYILFGDLRAGRLKLDDRVTVSRYASRLPGARMFLREGDQVPAEALFKGMLVQSGNDATVALIEKVSGDLPHFVERMNATAAQLGLTHSHFANATGLNNPNHYSCARDLARLAIALKRDYPEYAGWFSLKEYRWAGILQTNRNPLLRDPGVDGLKTGHTEHAGYCLIASAERAGMQLIAVILGAQTEQARAHSGRALLNFGFSQFETRLLYHAGAPLAELPLWQGEAPTVAVGLEQDLWLTLPRGHFDALQVQMALPKDQLAPVVRGQALGSLSLGLANDESTQRPLVALSEVPQGGFLRRAEDRLWMWLKPSVASAAP